MFILLGLQGSALFGGAPTAPDYRNAHIAWNSGSLLLIQQDAGYGRMARLVDRLILCVYEWNGGIYTKRSADEGRTWDQATAAAGYEFGIAANPELLVLRDGSILLFYNERPSDGVHPYTIRGARSYDDGRTWSDFQTVFIAGTTVITGCWEPAAVQLPSGELDLYFANEAPYGATNEQEISVLRSFDLGASWSDPMRASFRPGHRDGMPVPLVLQGDNEATIAIEDNGYTGNFSPALVDPRKSPSRWAALEAPPDPPVYMGAPYLRQFPSGITILSVQSGADRANPSSLQYSRMVVYLGDAEGKNFTNPSEPFAVPPNTAGLWNSLFIKNANTVTALTNTVQNGVRGLWAIDGQLEGPGVPVTLSAPTVDAVPRSRPRPAVPPTRAIFRTR